MPRFLVAALLLLVAAGCGGSSSEGSAPEGQAGGDVRLVAYSTPRDAYAKLIDLYRSGKGEGVSFRQSYGASGEQSRAVEAGLDADVVAFSLEPDMTRLVDAGLVDGSWNSGAHKGMVTDSVVVFMVREGNPKGIKGWDDLTKPGVEVLTPNPFTSGGARWNVMAGQERARVADDVHVREGRRPPRLRERGDLRPAPGSGGRVRRARPDDPDREPGRGDHRCLGRGQGVRRLPLDGRGAVFGDEGYRPVVESVAKTFDFPTPPALFTIADVGGWSKVQTDFFDRENGFMAEVQRELGQPTE